MSYDLAAIHTDAPLDFTPEAAVRTPADEPVLYELFLQLEFSKLIDKMGLKGGQGAERAEESVLPQVPTEVVDSPQRVRTLLKEWQSGEPVCFLALPSLDGVCITRGETLAVVHQDKVGAECYAEFLKTFFSGAVSKISHDVKDLMNQLLGEGLSSEGFVFDTALAAYLLSPTDGSYALDKLSVSYFSQELPPREDFALAEAWGPLSDPAPAVVAFSAYTGLVAALYRTFSPKLEELGMHTLYYQVDLPLCTVLAEMERKGFLVDQKALRAFGEMLTQGIAADQSRIYELAGEEFNINSTQQLGHILFDKLDLPPVKKTKTGYSTNAEVLEKLKGQHPIIEVILDYRQLAKLQSTYVEGLTKVIAEDGRIHTSFQNTVAATGRLSSTEPNLQNIPVRTELGAELRKMFVAPEGYKLVDADYSQIELRLLACISGDTVMQEAFKSGEDFHTITASRVFGVPVDAVSHEMRRRAKAVNFGIVYGISDFSLSQDIGVTRAEAKEYMEKYFETYHGVRDYMKRVVEQAKADGYVSTLMGRRRWLPELQSSNFNMRSFGERVALNMPIQGTAADLIKLAMIHVRNRLKEEKLGARLVLQVHDELIVECADAEVARVKALLTEEMEHVMDLPVPMRADSAVGQSWAEAKE